jgi:hypothetical protein
MGFSVLFMPGREGHINGDNWDLSRNEAYKQLKSKLALLPHSSYREEIGNLG